MLAECSAWQFEKAFLSKCFENVLNSFFMLSILAWDDQEFKKGHALRNLKSVSVLKWQAFQAKWLNPSESEKYTLGPSVPQINFRLLTNAWCVTDLCSFNNPFWVQIIFSYFPLSCLPPENAGLWLCIYYLIQLKIQQWYSNSS